MAYDCAPYLCPETFCFQPLLEATQRAQDQDDNDNDNDPGPPKRSLDADGAGSEAGLPPPKKAWKEGRGPGNSASPTPLSQQEGGRKRQRQCLKRLHQKQAAGHQVTPAAIQANVHAEAIQEKEVLLASLPVTACGYQALPLKAQRREFGLQQLVAEGFEVIPWDGRTARPFVDPTTKKVFMVLVGQPDKADFREACDRAADLIIRLGQAAEFSEGEAHHRRGDSPALNCGVSHGKGSTSAHNLCQGCHESLLGELLASEDIRWLAIFGSYSFQLWAPEVFKYYSACLRPLFERDPALKKIFDLSIFPTAAFNFGPQVCCYPHRDNLNCPFGWCAIQVLGSFDSTKGGHMVLPDLKLVIEFPAGALILLPSATLVHGNTPVGPGKTWVSFTQYCAGGLLCFIDNGFRTEKELCKKDKASYMAMMAQKEGRWEKGLGLLSMVEGLLRKGKAQEEASPKASPRKF